MYKNIIKCRICGGEKFQTVLKLGDQALTGVFPRSVSEKVTTGPVELLKCSASDGCGLVQLKQSYDISEMYGSNYGYRSGLNESMVRHLKSKVEKILTLGILDCGDLVIDIGSNDATTLRAYPKDRFQLVGIDPTGIKFSDYYPKEIKLIADFFSANVVFKEIKDKKAKVITSFSMFYDLEDPVTFAREIESTLTDDGVWIFEQSYLPAMLRTNSFDTICHEHLEFYALKQINWIADKAGLKILDVEFNDVNGGSFSITAAKSGSKYEPNHVSLNKILEEEKELGLETVKAFDGFQVRIENARRDLLHFLKSAKQNGKKVYGLGASTKGNVLLQYFDINSDLISAIGEVNQDKFGAYTPGTYIPIISQQELLNIKPDYLVVLPWHFRKFFEQLPALKGCNLVFPLPELQIVTL